MRNRWLLFALLLGLGLGLSGLPQQTVNADDAERISKLVGQLGSSKFAERDKAKRELEAIGQAALPALRKAVQSGDLETSRRAGELVKRMEQKITLDNLLAPKKLRLNVKEAPITEAVAQLAKLSGYSIELMGDRAALANRKVTLDTGETTFWQALDQLCQKAGLVETALNPYANVPRPQPALRIQPIQLQPVPAPAPIQPAPAKPGAQPAPPKALPAPMNNVQPGALQLQIDIPNVGAVPVQIEVPAAPAQPAPMNPAAPQGQNQPAGQGQVQPAKAIQILPAKAAQVQGKVQIKQARPVQIQVQPPQPAIAPLPAQQFNPGQINLTEGKRVEVPTHYAGAIRIRVFQAPKTNPQADPRLPQALPGGLPGMVPQRREGEAYVLLEVSAEPRLQGVQVVGEVQVDKALDDQGQKLTVPMDPMPPGNNPFGGRVAVNRVYYYNPYANNNLAVVRLKLGEKQAKVLKELSGHVPVQMLTPPEALISVEDVLKAKGKSVKGPHGGLIEITGIEKQGDGTYKVQFRFEAPPNHVAAGAPGLLIAPNGAVQVQQIQIQVGGGAAMPVRGGRVNAGNGLPELVDAKGKPFQLVSIPFRAGINGVAGQELTMVFRPQDGQGEPARFVLHGQRPVTVQVPFTLQNVPLP